MALLDKALQPLESPRSRPLNLSRMGSYAAIRDLERERKLRKHAKVKRSRPRTEEEKTRLVSLYFREIDNGRNVHEAAVATGVPYSTMNRWIAAQFRRPDPFNNSHDGPTISQAIETLCMLGGDELSQTHYKLEKVEALATFVCWLRWPRLSTSRRLGVISYVTTYVSRKFGAKRLCELAKSDRIFLESFLRLDLIGLMCSEHALYFPTFWKFDYIETGPHDENACLADLTWYLIAHEKDEHNSRNSPSIGKAVYLANRNAFKYAWSASSFAIRKMLRDRAPAAPFVFAQYQGLLDIPMEVDDQKFVDIVDSFLSDNTQIRKLMANALWVVEELRRKLDPRALPAFSFPSFPSDIEPEPFSVPPLTEKILIALKSYQTSAKTLDWFNN